MGHDLRSQSLRQGSTSQKNSRPVALTFGAAWADLFDESLARQLYGIVHWKAGSPYFEFTSTDLRYLRPSLIDPVDEESFLKRMNAPTTQASELVWRLEVLVASAHIVFIDTKMLDSAVGQHVLHLSKMFSKPVWAVGVDSKTSPLAPAYLRGILYPSSPDDLVKLTLQELHEGVNV